jgi:flagellar export protein FliJ
MSINERIRRFSGLISVYRQREDALARRMRAAEELAQRERSQLEHIEEIQAEYQRGLMDAGRAGTSAARMKNWQRFVRSLDAVHMEQNERTRRATGASNEHRDAWLMQYRRTKGFESLANNLANDRDAERRRDDQRSMDEIAGRPPRREK